MNWLRRRDPAVVAIVVTVIGALVVLLSVNLDRVPFLNSSTEYHAEFANAAGLGVGDDVRVAGLTVGSVSSIAVEGGHVDVGLELTEDVALGSTTSASVEVATVLGALFVQLDSAGPGRLADGATIPLARTAVPYTLIDVLDQAAGNTIRTDLPTFRRSLDTLAATLRGIKPDDVRATLEGITKVSTALASRQQGISRLLADTDTVLKSLSEKRESLVRLTGDAAVFARMLHERRDVINRLLTNTAALGREVSVLISRNGAKLGAVLAQLNGITAVLARDSRQLTASITQLGQFSTNVANVSGSGPWLDVLLPAFLEPDNVIAACGPNPKPGCGRK